MKCSCSRRTCGITIGSFYILGSLICLFFNVISYMEFNDKYEESERAEYYKSEAVKTMIICSLIVLLSALFIVAIVKKYHYLILPWLVVVIYVFYVTCGVIYIWFIGAGMGGASIITFLILLLVSILAIVGEIAIFSFSISMFRQMHKEKSQQQSESVRVDHQMADKSLI